MPVPTINPLGNMFQAVPRMMPINLRMMRPMYICFGIWIDVCIMLVCALYSVNELQNYVIQTRAPTVLYRLKFGEPADVFRKR